MGKSRGPACKLCRRQKEKLFLKGDRCFSAKCAIERRNFPPGIQSLVPKKLSEYGRRLREKQKMRFFYGVTERQMRVAFDRAVRKKGVTGVNLILSFEARLDSVLVRSGVFKSRRHARQAVLHRLILVNGHITSVPSRVIKIGEVISAKNEFILGLLRSLNQESLPSWLGKEGDGVKVLRVPERTEIDVPGQEQLIVEYYSR